MSAPVETKVAASSLTAAVAVIVAYLVSLIPGVNDMPAEVKAAVLVLLTGAVTFAAGWLAPHTPRLSDSLGNDRPSGHRCSCGVSWTGDVLTCPECGQPAVK